MVYRRGNCDVRSCLFFALNYSNLHILILFRCLELDDDLEQVAV